MEIGKIQTLKIVRIKPNGAYLSDPAGEEEEKDNAVLLPGKQVPENAKEGDTLDVFLYTDSSDRPIATTSTPLLTVGETGILTVKDTTKIGAFLDIGLEKDVLLPFKETEGKPEQGQKLLVALTVDKAGRLAATMHVYPFLKNGSPYKKDDEVTGTVYEVREGMGVFVAVDNRYFGLIPASEVYGEYRIGDEVKARVMRVREDGKLDLSPRRKAYLQMDDDAEKVLAAISDNGGKLPFTDKADPALIRDKFGMSKNEFKRAVGHLLKSGKIVITENSIGIK